MRRVDSGCITSTRREKAASTSARCDSVVGSAGILVRVGVGVVERDRDELGCWWLYDEDEDGSGWLDMLGVLCVS
jgi:hypothetical protein